jgi:hypothetical protein
VLRRFGVRFTAALKIIWSCDPAWRWIESEHVGKRDRIEAEVELKVVNEARMFPAHRKVEIIGRGPWINANIAAYMKIRIRRDHGQANIKTQGDWRAYLSAVRRAKLFAL